MNSLLWTRVVCAIAPVLASCGCRESVPTASLRLVVAMDSSVVTLDPHAHSQWPTVGILAHFCGALVAFGPEMSIRPHLAERWENPSENVWRFHLRGGVVFHDGRSLRAADVVASLHRAMRPDCPIRHYLHPVVDVREVNDLVFELSTRTSSPVLLKKLAFVSIVPRDAPESIVAPVGTGPYRFVSGRAGGRIEGTRFDRFWGERPGFETVSFVPVLDRDRRAEAIIGGQADIVCQFPRERWQWGREQAQMRMNTAPSLSVVMIAFSAAKGRPFADRRLRQAAGLAIDRQRLVDQGFDGLGAPLDQFVLPVVTGYANDLPSLAPDLSSARRLVEEAGYPRGISLPTISIDRYEKLVRALAQQLSAAGIRLEPRILPEGTFYAALTREELPATVFAWSAETGDASATFEPLFHGPASGFGSFNRFSYVNPTLDSLVERADQSADPSARLARFTEVARILRDDMPAIPLAVVPDLYAVREGVKWELPVHRFFRFEQARPAGR